MTLFLEFPKMARLRRECIVTEKIDGTNAQIIITPLDEFQDREEDLKLAVAIVGGLVIHAGSRTRIITPADDNAGFAGWVARNATEVVKLGVGRHYGEWWGSGLQRKYGLKGGDKRFSLFNTTRWCNHDAQPRVFTNPLDPRVEHTQTPVPAIMSVVPELYRGVFDTAAVEAALEDLRVNGSKAVPGFACPEGVVVFHTAAGVGFKRTLDKDEVPKGKR